jgi:Glyoxalase/Bleomycin resistance protein/Dioxygenase superfamily
MLKRVDRVQIAVRDAREAAHTIGEIFGSEVVRSDEVTPLRARRTTLQAGTSQIELLEPAADGPVSEFIKQWNDGLFGVGFSVADLDEAARRLERVHAGFKPAQGQIFVEPSATFGMRVVLSAHHERAPVGNIKWIYEVTNVIGNWRAAADRYTDLFGLEPSRFVPITSAEFGYTGSLLMFDKPARLDRIELAQITEPEKAMGRFHKRRGDSLYMFFVETDEVPAIAARLQKRGARFQAERRDAAGLAGLFIHPTAFCGVLVGVSRTENAWLWSGDPDRARRAAETRAKAQR